jgi:hypothetical protein
MSSARRRRRHFVSLAALSVAAAVAFGGPAGAIVPGDQPPAITLDPNTAGSKSKLALDTNTPQSQGSSDQAIRSVVLSGPRGLVVDPRSRARRCSPQQAHDFACPKRSKIGSGQASGHATGAIVPGGRQDFTAEIKVFLAPPVRKGDIAGTVVQVTETQSGFKGSATGRIVPAGRSKLYGVKLRFDDFPKPPSYPGVTISIDHVSLLAGARRKRHSLLTNPSKCRHGSWPFRIDVVYSDHSDRRDLAAACRPR